MRRQRPATDAEWARDTEHRIRRLESGSSTVRVGQWVLSDRDGELVATSLDGRSFVLSTLAEAATTTTTTVAGTSYTRVVTISYLGWATGGTFTLTFEGLTTDPIPYDASAAELQAALGALPNYAPSNFVVSGTDGGPWTVGIPGTSITGDSSGLTWFPTPENLTGVDIVIS